MMIQLVVLLFAINAITGKPQSRCAGLFDESCINGGLPGSNEEGWLGGNGLGKRCANLFDENCVNGDLPGSNEEEWLGGNGLGKRQVGHPNILKSLSDFFNRAHMVATKRCAHLFDESCANGGLPGSNDEEWLGGSGPGKRSYF